MATKKTYKAINPKAKKYQSIAKKQALVNKYLRNAKETLGADHRSYVATLEKIHRFQKKHNLTRQSKLSMTGLKTNDVKMYDTLLDSIIDSTFINPEKYKAHVENQAQFFIDQGWGSDEDEVKVFMEFRDSPLFEELEDIIQVPSSLLDKASEFTQADLSLDDFKQAIRLFMKEYDKHTYSKKEFFEFTDKYMEAKAERDDFDKAYNEYMQGNTPKSFFDWLNEF